MRILHLIASEGLYGSGRVVIELSKALNKTINCQPIVGVIKNSYSSDVSLIDEAKANDIDVKIFPCDSQFDLKAIFSIRKYIKNHKIDLLHCHGYKSNFYGLMSFNKKIPKVTTNHNWLTSHWKLKIYCLLDALWIRYFDKIIAVSDQIKQKMLNYKIRDKKIIVIDNGIGMDKFNHKLSSELTAIKLGINGNYKIIGTIGSLRYEKGHKYLLQSVKSIIKKNKYLKFIIIGDGSLRKQLEDEIKSLDISQNVILTGYREDIPELLSIMDIFVLPSIIEGLPMVILEAMAAKKPVIATSVGAIPKVIINKRNGILINPKKAEEISSAVSFLLNNNERSQKIAIEGYLTVKKDYSSKKMCTEYMKLYKELIYKNN